MDVSQVQLGENHRLKAEEVALGLVLYCSVVETSGVTAGMQPHLCSPRRETQDQQEVGQRVTEDSGPRMLSSIAFLSGPDRDQRRL